MSWLLLDLFVQSASDEQLRAFYTLVGDREKLGEIDRKLLGQTGGVELTELGRSNG